MRKYVAFGIKCFALLLGLVAIIGGKILAKGISKAISLYAADPFSGVMAIALLLICFVGVIYLALLKDKTARFSNRLKVPFADSVLADDDRRPILYLRAFDDDEKFPLEAGVTLEQAVVECLQVVGPVIAIGRPGEWAPPLGAARTYVDNNWKSEVRELITNSRFIIVLLSTTPGVAWELKQLLHLSVLNKAIFVLPPVSCGELQRRWDLLVALFDHDRALDIPERISANAVFATFNTDGKCIMHESVGVRSTRLFNACASSHYSTPLEQIIRGIA